MKRKAVSTSLEDAIIERIAVIQSKQLGASQAIIIRAAVERGLPVLEAEILGPQFAGKNIRTVKEAA
jgi:hypothetical protein